MKRIILGGTPEIEILQELFVATVTFPQIINTYDEHDGVSSSVSHTGKVVPAIMIKRYLNSGVPIEGIAVFRYRVGDSPFNCIGFITSIVGKTLPAKMVIPYSFHGDVTDFACSLQQILGLTNSDEELRDLARRIFQMLANM